MSSFDDDLSRRVRDAAPEAFAPGFARRVMARLDRPAIALDAALQRHFIRIVPFVAAASLVLAAYNWWGAHASSASTLDAALRLPRVSVAAAYSSDVLFDAYAP